MNKSHVSKLLGKLAVLQFYLVFMGLNCAKSGGTNEFAFSLKTSKVNGIGVFANRDIGAGTKINLRPDNYKVRIMRKQEIPAQFTRYCTAIGYNLYECPPSFNMMPLDCYLNHSKKPNIEILGYAEYYAMRDINKGEEIFIDYNQLNEPESMKEWFY